ncbi:MAG TPA: hypothetical protein VIK78_19755 [Ruminiclostridium sp.]
MAYKTTKFNIQAQPQPKFWPSSPSLLNGGVNYTEKEYKLAENQSPNILNMTFINGELGIRAGQEHLNAAEVVEPICYGSYKYKFMGNFVKHCGTQLYKQDAITGVSTSIFSGLNASESKIFKFNGKLYLKQTGKYIVWDGTTATAVIPYIPTVIINRTPTGGGDTNENYNRLGAGLTNKFHGNNVATVFTLTDVNLDATVIICTIGGVVKTEGTHFSVNRTTGLVTFSTAPAIGINNVILTLFKTVQTDIDAILNCLAAIAFGGQNDNRLFVGNNGSGYFYWTGITTAGIDPTYFAYNNYNIIGLTDENITGFGKHYDTLCILKEREIYGETYSFDGTKGVFNTFAISSEIGCDCPNTIQSINNNLTFLNSRNGAYVLVGTAVNSQRNVFPISRNINPRLLAETNLKSASSIDFNGKYWLCVNDKVYLWDYFLSPYSDTGNPEESAKRLSWWYFDSINAASWLVDDTLMYCDRATGLTVQFHNDFHDFGGLISALYRYPLRLIGGGIYEFDLLTGYVMVRGDTRSTFKVVYFTSDDIFGDSATERIEVGSFSWSDFSWSSFTYGVMGPLFNWELSPYEKGIRYFGCEFTNEVIGTDMNISGVQWRYKIGKLIR